MISEMKIHAIARQMFDKHGPGDLPLSFHPATVRVSRFFEALEALPETRPAGAGIFRGQLKHVLGRDGIDEGPDDDTQQLCQPPQQQAEVIAGGSKDGVDPVAETSLEVIAVHAMLGLDVADDGLVHLLPKRGDKLEWQHSQDYWAEKDQIPAIDLDDTAFVYG